MFSFKICPFFAGYAAAGVVRQRGVTTEVTVIDMSKSAQLQPAKEAGAVVEKDSGKHEKSIKHRKGESDPVTVACQFNPALQELASRLSNKTRAFTLNND